MKKCKICGNLFTARKKKQTCCSNDCRLKNFSKNRYTKNVGKNAYQWKENVGYQTNHNWIRKWKGKANHCEHCGKVKSRYEWANIDHKYKRNLEEYISLCSSCHKKHDAKLRRPDIDISKIKKLFAIGFSLRKIARELNIGSHKTVKNYLNI